MPVIRFSSDQIKRRMIPQRLNDWLPRLARFRIRRGWIFSSWLLLSACAPVFADDGLKIEAESAKRIGGAAKVADTCGFGRLSGCLEQARPRRQVHRPAGCRQIGHSLCVAEGGHDQRLGQRPARPQGKRPFFGSPHGLLSPCDHRDGDSRKAALTISLADNDVPVNIDRIVVGDGDLGLPPDIWNLPPLQVADGPYSADWKALSRIYAVPEWWRDAKFGAWAHWDPQSMPEQGDWYSRGMYQEGSRQYNYHLKHFGHPSEYGYKDICHNWVIDRWKPDELMDLYAEMGARTSWRWAFTMTTSIAGIRPISPGTPSGSAPRWTLSAPGKRRRASTACVSASGSITLRLEPRASSCRCATPATSGGRKKACLTMRCKRFWTEKANGGKAWTQWTSTVRPHAKDPLHSPFANQFMWRVDDAITKYHPDVIYFDERRAIPRWIWACTWGLAFSLRRWSRTTTTSPCSGTTGKWTWYQSQRRGRSLQQLQKAPRTDSHRGTFPGQELRGHHRIADHGLSVPDRNHHRGLALPRPGRDTWTPEASSGR